MAIPGFNISLTNLIFSYVNKNKGKLKEGASPPLKN